MLTQKTIDDFFTVSNSLKKFKRAELVDDKDRSLIEKLYADLLPDNQVYKNALSDNTTFLIGRKGTGKSTLILRLESEYRKRKDYISCYIDTKTVFEKIQGNYQQASYLKDKLPIEALEKYLIERTFIQNMLKEIVSELEQSATVGQKIGSFLGVGAFKTVKKKITELASQIESNDCLKEIELPVFSEYKKQLSCSQEVAQVDKIEGKLSGKVNPNSFTAESSATLATANNNKEVEAWEKSFSGALLKVFQIKSVIESIQEILKILGIKKLVVFLDDFSEVDEKTIKNFVNVVLAPLNNWGEEFISFKVAAYPTRVYYGEIDKGKVDILDLDFYNLYSSYGKTTMESLSLEFTKRLLSTRLAYYTNNSMDDFFDTRLATLDEYYALLFKASMNVPRIIGYILFYCHQTSISLGRKITKKTIDSAAQQYYEKVIVSFFEKSTISKSSFDEKVSVIQQKKLLQLIVNRLKEIRKHIRTGELTAFEYQTVKKNPYSSHFNIFPDLEKFLRTLELNFFISKYQELSDRDGQKTSIYCLNYGLTCLENMRWGKPEGTEYRKYFITRSFAFSGLVEDFLSKSKHIVCTSCGASFPYEDLDKFEFFKMKCSECYSPVRVQNIAENISQDLEKIDKRKQLHKIESSILYELYALNSSVFARELAEELDLSIQLISSRARKLAEKDLVNRRRDSSNKPYQYSIAEKAEREYFSARDTA